MNTLKLLTICTLVACTLIGCSSKQETIETDIQMPTEEPTTETTTEPVIVLQKQTFDDYTLVKELGFIEKDDAMLSSSGEKGFTIDFIRNNKQGFISVTLNDDTPEDYAHQIEAISKNAIDYNSNPSNILPEGWKEVVYTSTVDEGEVTRIINYKSYKQGTIVITAYMQASDYDVLMPKAVSIIQSFEVI